MLIPNVSQFHSWAAVILTAAFYIDRDTQTPKHSYISICDKSTLSQMSEHVHFHAQMFQRNSEFWYISFEEYPLLRTTSMRFRSFFSPNLVKKQKHNCFLFFKVAFTTEL